MQSPRPQPLILSVNDLFPALPQPIILSFNDLFPALP